MPTAVGKIIPHRPSSCQEKNAKKLYKNAAPKKFFFVHFDEEKSVDILTRVCYYNYRKRKKGDKKNEVLRGLRLQDRREVQQQDRGSCVLRGHQELLHLLRGQGSYRGRQRLLREVAENQVVSNHHLIFFIKKA